MPWLQSFHPDGVMIDLSLDNVCRLKGAIPIPSGWHIWCAGHAVTLEGGSPERAVMTGIL